MGFKNNLMLNLINKIGNLVFKIENINEKGVMFMIIKELNER